MKPPENLYEMITYIDQHKHLTLECENKNEEIISISKFIEVIGEIYL